MESQTMKKLAFLYQSGVSFRMRNVAPKMDVLAPLRCRDNCRGTSSSPFRRWSDSKFRSKWIQYDISCARLAMHGTHASNSFRFVVFLRSAALNFRNSSGYSSFIYLIYIFSEFLCFQGERRPEKFLLCFQGAFPQTIFLKLLRRL